jgi:hypothetical protein
VIFYLVQAYSAVNTIEVQMNGDDGISPSNALPQRARDITFFASIRTKFWGILLLLFVALLIIMIITIVTLQDDGSTWMDQTSADMLSQQVTQLSALVDSKSLFIEVFCDDSRCYCL